MMPTGPARCHRVAEVIVDALVRLGVRRCDNTPPDLKCGPKQYALDGGEMYAVYYDPEAQLVEAVLVGPMREVSILPSGIASPEPLYVSVLLSYLRCGGIWKTMRLCDFPEAAAAEAFTMVQHPLDGLAPMRGSEA